MSGRQSGTLHSAGHVRDPLASFIPVAVERRLREGIPLAPWHEPGHGAILVADVSGSTNLACTLAASPGGVDELSAVLNAGLAPVIDTIGAAGGDILFFAGDGLTAFWRGAGGTQRAGAGATQHAAGIGATWRAVAAAVAARRAIAGGDPRVGIRFGVASGPVDLWNLGGERDQWLHLASGPALADAAAGQAAVAVGEVAVTAAVAGVLGTGFELATRGGVTRVLAAPTVPDAPVPGNRGALDHAIAPLVRPYLPDAVVARLAAGLDHYMSEIRTVTALFVRLPDLTTSATLGDMQALTSALQGFVNRYQSVVNRLSVDEHGALALVVFGTPPHAHEDDADRALAAARDLDHELGGRGLRHGLGIATGTVFCGTLGTAGRRDYTVLGDTVNVAARLAGAAVDDSRPSVLCDERTRADVGGRWEFGTPFSLRVKGKAELVTASTPRYRVAPRASFASPMVGRATELAQLERLVRAATPGALALVVGEAGMGKSRLLSELRRRVAGDDRTVLTGHADPLAASSPYHVWRPVLRALLECAAADGTDLLGEDAPLLAAIVGAESPAGSDRSGEARVAAVRRAITSLLARAVRRHGPLVVLLEDAHWFDSASWATLADAAALDGVVVVVTTRPLPEPAPTERTRLLGRPSTEVLHLKPLSPGEVGELAKTRLGADAVGADLRALLVGRCGGNPFFTVEVLAALQRAGTLRRRRGEVTLGATEHVAVPETIQLAITSRIDQLDADQQLTLKVAGVVGERITLDAVATIHPTSRPNAAITADLAVLVAADFLTAAPTPDGYEFTHALIGEAAYHLMLVEQRTGLHRALAEYYELTGDPRAMAAVLALHWRKAADDQRAVHYLRIAVVEAIADGMPREAVAHAVTAAGLLGIDLPTDQEVITAALPAALAEIDRLMAGRHPADLETLPELLDDGVGAGLELIYYATPAAHLTQQPELFVLMVLRNLSLTLRFGAGPYAPGVYAMYSIVVRALGLDSATALEFSELALRLDAATGGRLTAPVAFLHALFQHHWHHPMAGGVTFGLAAAQAGLGGADLLYGACGLGAAITLAAVAGRPLAEIRESALRYRERIGGHSAAAAFHCTLEAQLAKALSGRTATLVSLTDSWCHEDELAAMAASDNISQAGYYYVAKCRLAYLAGDAATARGWAARATELLPAFVGQVPEIELAVLTAMAALADLPAAGPPRRQRVDHARAQLVQLEHWAVHCPANFAHKVSLVAAELAFVEDDGAAGRQLGAAAVSAAIRDGFPQWAGLAAQRWAQHTAQRDPSAAARLFGVAAGHYRSWGAERLAMACDQRADELSGTIDPVAGSGARLAAEHPHRR
ncbi:MAG: AAA family ATPase [Pseudonocardiaceae bacterium]